MSKGIKIGFGKDYKRIFTLENLEGIKAIKASFDPDNWLPTIDCEGRQALALASHRRYDAEILTASATWCKNCRIWDFYADGSGDVDVWLEFRAMGDNKAYDIRVCLSDLYQMMPDESTDDNIRSHMYIREFKVC